MFPCIGVPGVCPPPGRRRWPSSRQPRAARAQAPALQSLAAPYNPGLALQLSCGAAAPGLEAGGSVWQVFLLSSRSPRPCAAKGHGSPPAAPPAGRAHGVCAHTRPAQPRGEGTSSILHRLGLETPGPACQGRAESPEVGVRGRNAELKSQPPYGSPVLTVESLWSAGFWSFNGARRDFGRTV